MTDGEGRGGASEGKRKAVELRPTLQKRETTSRDLTDLGRYNTIL